MSAAGPPQGARPPQGGAAHSAVRGEPSGAAGPPQGARPPQGGAARSAVRGGQASAGALPAAPAADFGALAALRWALVRDLRIALRSRAELGVQVLFFVIVVSLFPLASSPERNLLQALGPGVLWVAALLASLLSLPRLFASDLADGTLEQMALSPYPLPALVGGKVLAHWLATGLPLAVLAPLLGLQYALDGDTLATIALSLLIGTPILSLVGAIGAALTLNTRGGGSLLALLVLPLYAPVLIFGAGSADALRAGLSATPNLSLLGAGLLVAVVGAPLAAAAAVRIALD